MHARCCLGLGDPSSSNELGSSFTFILAG